MFELKSSIKKDYNRSIPNINFSDDGILWNLVSLVNVDMNIYQYLGLLFLRLGFEPEDNILLCNYDKDSSSFDCVLNKSEIYRVTFNKKDSQIFVRSHNIVYGYQCEPLAYGEIGMRVSLGSYTYEYADGMKFTRYLSRNYAKFESSVCDSLIELELRKPDDINLPMYDEHGIYAKYKLGCEEELIKYMSSLDNFNKPIVDIYAEISDRFIGDVSKYPSFVLKRSRIQDDEKLKVIDLINLNNGELEKFAVTSDDSFVFLDKYDNFSVELLSRREYPVKFFMASQEGKETYGFSVEGDALRVKEYTNYGMRMDINDAYEELTDVSVKVRKLFNKDSK